MNPAAVAALSKRGSDQRAAAFPTRIVFRGIFYTIAKPTTDPSLTLTVGGFEAAAVFHLRLPASIQPPPADMEQIQEVSTGRIYYVRGLTPAPPECAAAVEHIVTATLA